MQYKSYLYLTQCPVHNNMWGLNLLANNKVLLENFKQRCYRLPKSVHWFHQSNSNEYQLFEFWTDKQDLILEECEKVANDLALILNIEEPTSKIIREIVA